jgi:hypothetical protein
MPSLAGLDLSGILSGVTDAVNGMLGHLTGAVSELAGILHLFF